MKHWRQLNKIKTKQTRLNLLNSSIFNRENNTMLQNTHTHWSARTCKWDLVGEKQTQHTHTLWFKNTHTNMELSKPMCYYKILNFSSFAMYFCKLFKPFILRKLKIEAKTDNFFRKMYFPVFRCCFHRERDIRRAFFLSSRRHQRIRINISSSSQAKYI